MTREIPQPMEALRARPGQATTHLYAAICDLNGTLRGKRLPVEAGPKVEDGQLRMPLSVACVDVWGEDIEGSALVFESGDADGICEWTGRGPLPFGAGGLFYPLWMREDDGTPFDVDPRRALAAVLDRYAAKGLTPVVATELEFYLYQSGPNGHPVAPVAGPGAAPLAGDSVLSLAELRQVEAFLGRVYAACAAQDVPADAAIAENGPGQFEVNLTHIADAMKAADDTVLFKDIVRTAAAEQGLGATFMAKPYADRAGSGFHIHFSLLDESGANVFDDGSAQGSTVMMQALGGLLESMHDSMLIFAPHRNSYRRLRPGAHAPTTIGWGYENRTTAIRIPGGPAKARRIEHRVAGADANPYLVMAALLGAAMAGMEAQLIPRLPHGGNAYDSDLDSLPGNWTAAVDAFEGSALVRAFLPERLCRMFVDCKRQELARFENRITDFEYKSYLATV